MPIYLVRWGDLSVSLIKARNKKDLFAVVDEIADPHTCKVQVYDGPLHIRLKLKVDFKYEKLEKAVVPEKPTLDLARIRNLKADGKGWRTIAAIFSQESGSPVSHMAVKRALGRADITYMKSKGNEKPKPNITDVSNCIDQWCFELDEEKDDGFGGYRMRDEIVRLAFPYYAQYLGTCGWREVVGSDVPELNSSTVEQLCKEAMVKELEIPFEKDFFPEEMKSEMVG